MFDNKKIYLTLDIDWASDEVLSFVLDYFIHNNIKATFFATHQTELLNLIKERNDLFSLGIHPNFLENSTHGKNIEEVLDYVLSIVPEAKVSRSHSVVQSGRVFSALYNKKIKVDTSIMLPYYNNVESFKQYVGEDEYIIRAPFIWADDYELCKKEDKFDEDIFKNINGLKIIMFHPIHLYLNSLKLEDYNNYKKTQKVTKNSNGTFNFLEKLTMSDLNFEKMEF